MTSEAAVCDAAGRSLLLKELDLPDAAPCKNLQCLEYRVGRVGQNGKKYGGSAIDLMHESAALTVLRMEGRGCGECLGPLSMACTGRLWEDRPDWPLLVASDAADLRVRAPVWPHLLCPKAI